MRQPVPRPTGHPLAWGLTATAGLGALALGAPVAAAGLAAASVAAGAWLNAPANALARRDPVTRLPLGGALMGTLDAALAGRDPDATALFLFEIDRFARLEERHDRAGVERVLLVAAHRLEEGLRGGDLAARLDGPTFAVALTHADRLDLEAALQLAARLQRTLAEPIPVDGVQVQIDVSVGFALPGRLTSPTGDTLLAAARIALLEARKSGPGAIRSYSDAMAVRRRNRHALGGEAEGAIERGEFVAHFQPQIDAMSGAVSGFEALARWHHPSRGLVPPADFLPALDEARLIGRLSAFMVRSSLDALTRWGAAGLSVPRVAVNFSHSELCDPRLVDRLAWELDRHELSPDRLVIEVLETVVSTGSDDVVIRNLGALARLGCILDLDDFGTGQTSITSIRRFAIARIKIDRSFVTGIDADADQQRMVSAILTMAERLGLETLAEGVETETERRTLTRLGVGHLQGYGIARPMPFDETLAWLGGEGRHAGNVERLRRA